MLETYLPELLPFDSGWLDDFFDQYKIEKNPVFLRTTRNL